MCLSPKDDNSYTCSVYAFVSVITDCKKKVHQSINSNGVLFSGTGTQNPGVLVKGMAFILS